MTRSKKQANSSKPSDAPAPTTEPKVQLDIVNEFTKLQRGAVIAEILFAKGQYEMMQRTLFEMTQIGAKINAMIGGTNGREEAEPHKEANP